MLSIKSATSSAGVIIESRCRVFRSNVARQSPILKHGIVRLNRLEPPCEDPLPPAMRNPFRYFNSSPEVIRLTVMMYIRYPLSLRQLEDILFERGIDICHETIRFWWNRFGPMFEPC